MWIVDANYKGLITCKAHGKLHDPIVIADESHVVTREYVDNMCKSFPYLSTRNSSCVEVMCRYVYFMWNVVPHGI